MKDETIGNQQITSEELAWFAGIIDANGTLSIASKPNKNKTRSYWVFVQILSKNEDLIIKCIELIKKLGVNPYVMEKKEFKKEYQILIQRMSKAKKIIKPIYPYLVAKKRQAELILKFINSRFEKFEKGKGKYNPYTEEEISWINEIKRLNFRGNLRDYTPESLNGIRYSPNL